MENKKRKLRYYSEDHSQVFIVFGFMGFVFSLVYAIVYCFFLADFEEWYTLALNFLGVLAIGYVFSWVVSILYYCLVTPFLKSKKSKAENSEELEESESLEITNPIIFVTRDQSIGYSCVPYLILRVASQIYA